MPRQLTLATQADGGFETYRKPTRRDIFPAEMDTVVPWATLCALIEPFYPKPRAAGGGRPVVGLERMLRIPFVQQWDVLSDPAVEEALYDSAAMRRFVGIDLGRESAPDETTVCTFRPLLEKHGLAERVFKAVSQRLHVRRRLSRCQQARPGQARTALVDRRQAQHDQGHQGRAAAWDHGGTGAVPRRQSGRRSNIRSGW